MRNTEAVRREEEKVGKFGREQAINTCVNEAPAFDSRYGDGPDFVCKCCSIFQQWVAFFDQAKGSEE